MATRLKPPATPTPATPTPAAQKPAGEYVRGDEIPVPDVIEKDSDSVWALWTKATAEAAEAADKFVDTQPITLLMGLPELPKDSNR